MNLYLCWFCNDEFDCYVIAPSRNKAKYMFSEYFSYDGDYVDVRCKKLKDAGDCSPGVYDDNCSLLDQLGVRYLSYDDLMEMEGEQE